MVDFQYTKVLEEVVSMLTLGGIGLGVWWAKRVVSSLDSLREQTLVAFSKFADKDESVREHAALREAINAQDIAVTRISEKISEHGKNIDMLVAGYTAHEKDISRLGADVASLKELVHHK